MKNLFSYFIILLPFYSICQPTLEFQNLTPIWKHTSEIPENMDGNYNGIAPLITDTDLFLPTLLVNKSPKGYLLERIDLHSGNVQWKSYYYPLGQKNREYPQRPFLYDTNVVMPSFHENDDIEVDKDIWKRARLAYRVFDFESGEVIDSLISDSEHTEIHMPWATLFGNPSLTNNNGNIQYFDTYGSVVHSFKFNSNGDVVLDTMLKPLTPVFNTAGGSYFISKRKIVIFLSMNENFTKENTMRVDIHNLDFDFQKTLDITKYLLPAREHFITYADDSYFIIESRIKKSTGQNTSIITNRNFYMFDYDGNLIDKFFLNWERERIGNKYYYNIYVKPNAKGDKMLALVVNDNADGFHTLYVKESDGQDNLTTLAEFTAKYAANNFDIFHFNLTPTGDLLVDFQYIEQINPDAEYGWSWKSVTMLISKDDF